MNELHQIFLAQMKYEEYILHKRVFAEFLEQTFDIGQGATKVCDVIIETKMASKLHTFKSLVEYLESKFGVNLKKIGIK